MGATGATGKHLVKQLLKRGMEVTAVVRSGNKLLDVLKAVDVPPGLEIVEGEVLSMSSTELTTLLSSCDCAASCLGHNLTRKGIYGSPRYLVTDSARRVCMAVIEQNREHSWPFRFILMNTSGNMNPDEAERRNAPEMLLTGLIRLFLPPHRDNEHAAEYLRKGFGGDKSGIEWAAVRPDTLVDEEMPTKYNLHPSPVRSPLFNPGKTSRVNVAHFIADLAGDESVWTKWKGRMPVIYNDEAMIS
jgi:nucleoside-diphosphate-sugar epimerase